MCRASSHSVRGGQGHAAKARLPPASASARRAPSSACANTSVHKNRPPSGCTGGGLCRKGGRTSVALADGATAGQPASGSSLAFCPFWPGGTGESLPFFHFPPIPEAVAVVGEEDGKADHHRQIGRIFGRRHDPHNHQNNIVCAVSQTVQRRTHQVRAEARKLVAMETMLMARLLVWNAFKIK